MPARIALPLVAAILAAAVGATSAIADAPTFTTNVKASAIFDATGRALAGWNEPAGTTGSDGAVYAAFQAPSSLDRSTDGRTWADPGFTRFVSGRADGDTGDVTMTADSAGTVFVGHLNGNLQAVIDWTRDGGRTWASAGVPFTGASTQPFLVDRPWIASYSPDGDFHHTKVYLEYHDFAPSFVWVATCDMATGSLSCGTSVPVVHPPTFCNSIPGGIAVAPPGSPHAGRLYAAWITADPATNVLSGCNETQLAPFYQLYVATSDDGSNWTPRLAYRAPNDPNCPNTTAVAGASTPTCTDLSEIFTQIAVDGGGNAYVSFTAYDARLGPNYNVYLARSLDGGASWDGATDGSGLPYRVSSLPGRHWFPAIVAGDAGRIAVEYIRSPLETGPFQHNATCPSVTIPACDGKPRPMPPSAPWATYVAESLNAGASTPTFSEVQVSDPGVAIHYGDNCNLGIYCSATGGNRTLLDAISVFVDRAGYLQLLWTDQREDPNELADNAGSGTRRFDQVYYACQSGGTPLYAVPLGAPVCGPAAAAPGGGGSGSGGPGGSAATTGTGGTAAGEAGNPFTAGPAHRAPLFPAGLLLGGGLLAAGALARRLRRRGVRVRGPGRRS